MTSKERKQFSAILRRIDWIFEHGTHEQKVAIEKVMRALKRLKDAKSSRANVKLKDTETDIWFVIDGGKRPSRNELERRMDELASEYAANHDQKVKFEIEKLSRLLARWNETLH